MANGEIELKQDAFAIVWHPEDGWSLMVPNEADGDKEMPREALALTGAFIRLDQDHEFREECAEFFLDTSKS